MAGGTTIVDRLNKLSGKDATTIAKALENLEEGGGIGGFEIHICASGEYDAETKVPIIEEPDTSTLYLVPTSSKSKNMFDEYVWTGTDWEKFGTGSVALPSPTTSDNGKVLGVDGGEYKLVEKSGGAEVELLANTTSEESFVDGNTLHASGIVTSGISVGTDGAAPGYNIPNSSIPSSVYNKLTKSNLGIGIMHFYYLNGPSSSDVKCVSIPCNIIKSNGYVRLEPSGAMYQPLWQGSWALSYDIAIPII